MRLQDAVNTLNLSNPPEVARHLLLSGSKGKRRDCRKCPVAVYLSALVGQQVVVSHCGARLENFTQFTKLPGVLTLFIGIFDGGFAGDELLEE